MEFLQSQDGQPFIRAVAQYIRQHEKALANSLQLNVQRRKPTITNATPTTPTSPSTTLLSSTSALAAALSFAGLNFRSPSIKSAQLTLTPHHLFYLLSRIEELDVGVGPMNVRIESIHNDSSQSNYVSFLQTHTTSTGRSDADSIHSVSSVRSVMSGMSALWSGMGLSTSSKIEKAKLALENDMKYIYAAFTKLPALRFTPDHRTPMIKGYEQFPFDTAVPLFAFKNLQQLEIADLDFRSFHGWDRLADQLCLLTIKRGKLEDPIELLEHIVLDDAEKRRRRSDRAQKNAPSTPSWSMPSTPRADYARSVTDPGSPQHASPGRSPSMQSQGRDYVSESTPVKSKVRSQTVVDGPSPKRPVPSRPASSYRHVRAYSSKAKRSGSGSSNSSDTTTTPARSDAAANTYQNVLPASKWQRLVYLSLADNGLTELPERSIQPLVPSLRSLNLSSNLFTEIPESLVWLSRLVSLDLSNCMIVSLQTLVTHPLPVITTLKLKSNRLQSLAGVEQLSSLENLNVQDNMLTDPDESARLAQIPSFRRLWIRHNPLTKKYPEYRIRILNHFRRVPGFSEDVILDDQPAFYSERKQLIDRATEIEHLSPALIKPIEQKIVLLQEPSISTRPVREASNRPSLMSLQQEPSTAPTNRRRSSRRRIVDLSASDYHTSTQHVNFESPNLADTSNSIKVVLESSASLSSAEDRPNLTRLSSSPIPITDDEMAKTLTNNSPTGDDYRRDIENLRMKYGNNWLTALGDQHNSQTFHQPPKLHHYHSTPPAVDVGGNVS